MQRLSPARGTLGFILLDALLALGLWSLMGMGLMMQARSVMVAQRSLWRQAQAIEWQADLFERIRLAHPLPPLVLQWGQQLQADDCIQSPCRLSAWRDSLLADWQRELAREMPGSHNLVGALVRRPAHLGGWHPLA